MAWPHLGLNYSSDCCCIKVSVLCWVKRSQTDEPGIYCTCMWSIMYVVFVEQRPQSCEQIFTVTPGSVLKWAVPHQNDHCPKLVMSEWVWNLTEILNAFFKMSKMAWLWETLSEALLTEHSSKKKNRSTHHIMCSSVVNRRWATAAELLVCVSPKRSHIKTVVMCNRWEHPLFSQDSGD